MRERLSFLLEKYIQGQLGTEELNELYSLIEKPELKEVFSAYYADKWKEADSSPSEESLQRQAIVWKQLCDRIRFRQQFVKHLSFISWRPWLKIASVVFVPILFVALGIYLGKNLPNILDQELLVSVDPGQKANVTLPDGTKVYLNSASRLSYNNDFNKKERRVYLSGEAFFEVQKNEKSPFVVETFDGTEVKALGTKFDVKAYDDDMCLTSTLIQGSILVSRSGQSQILSPYESIAINKSSGKWKRSRIESDDEILSWMNNTLYFKQQSLGEIAKVLERTYAVSIVFETDDIKHLRYSGTIKNNSLKNILSLIVSVSPTPIEYEIENSKVVLTKK